MVTVQIPLYTLSYRALFTHSSLVSSLCCFVIFHVFYSIYPSPGREESKVKCFKVCVQDFCEELEYWGLTDLHLVTFSNREDDDDDDDGDDDNDDDDDDDVFLF